MAQPGVSPSSPYSQADRKCDIVMKGGVTSGIAYPLAVCVLAQTYRFVNIGGASAGAIAAAATAAAEHGRSHGGGGFVELENLPSWFQEEDNLMSLFQPSAETRPWFDLVIALLGPSSGIRKILRVLRALWSTYWATLVVATFLSLTLGSYVFLSQLRELREGTPAPFLWPVISTLLSIGLCLLAFAVALASRLLTRLRGLPENFYGMCNGMDSSYRPNREPLTVWLDRKLQSLAGIQGRPMIFRDLWGPDPAAEKDASKREVNLEMITTNISHGRPYRLPFEADADFFFCLEEWRRLFPEWVLTWLTHDPQGHAKTPIRWEHKTLYALPPPGELPVLVAVRMSLSFPILLSAIPLYTADYGWEVVDEAEQEGTGQKSARRRHRGMKRCWFSDGGISSNFPVHLFDTPLPRWPTFAINLRSYEPGLSGGPKRVTMAPSNQLQNWETWNYFEDERAPLVSLGRFLLAIVETMRNWVDNTQSVMPGYRDRIVHISLTSDEGGLNLTMPARVIREVSGYGREAGIQLVDRFVLGRHGHMNWENHRWVRYRTLMASIEQHVEAFRTTFLNPLPPDPPLSDLISAGQSRLPDSFPWASLAQASQATATTAAILGVPLTPGQPGSFDQGAPEPIGPLRIRAKV